MKKTIALTLMIFLCAGLAARPLKIWKESVDVKPVEVIDGKALGVPVPPDAKDVHGWQECSDIECPFALTFTTEKKDYYFTDNGKPKNQFKRIRGIDTGCTGDGKSGGVRIFGRGKAVYILHPCRR